LAKCLEKELTVSIILHMIISQETLKEKTGCDYYDGSVIHERFAYKFFGKEVSPFGNIVAFRAPMEVTDNLIDLEDSLNKDYIYSDDAVNLIMEIPNADLFGGVCFQRLLNAQIGSIICSTFLEQDGYVDGDDIMILDEEKKPKKASVSIAAYKSGAVLIHTGINIKAGDRAPDFAYSTNLDDDKVEKLMYTCCAMFQDLVRNIFVATTKVIV